MFRIGFHGARVVTMALACAAPVALLASANGPVPARTGGFGEMTCHQCHSNNPLNDPSGTLTLSGVPDAYTSGQPYMITIAVAHPQLIRAGFQLSARFESGENAGTLRPGAVREADRPASTGLSGRTATRPELTETIPDDGGRITYIQHTAMGSLVAVPGKAQWTFEWTAPDAIAAVVFHLAANAANGDGLSRGDFVYTASATSPPAAAAR